MDCKTYIKFCVVGGIFFCLHQTLISNIFVCYSCNLAVATMYEQADGTYAHNIEKLVRKVCALAHENGDEHQRHCLRASSLQCLSAMVVLYFNILIYFPDLERHIENKFATSFWS
jgi:hypothetical protein